jgi:hypothetical protein
LAVILLCGLLPTDVFAAGEDYSVNLAASTSAVYTGDAISVTLKVSSSTKATYNAIQVGITYDASKVEYKSAESVVGATEKKAVTNKVSGNVGTVTVSAYGGNFATSGAGTDAATLKFEVKPNATGVANFSIANPLFSISGDKADKPAANSRPSTSPVSVAITTVAQDGDPWVAADLMIYTAEDLFAFAESVNSGNSYAGKVVRLATDIDLNDALWTSIGIYLGDNGDKPFAGVFDADGYTIRGLRVTADSAADNSMAIGLFGYTENATIKNLTVAGTVNSISNNIINVGAVIGYSLDTRVSNCINYASISVGKPNGTSAGNIGGIVGNQYHQFFVNNAKDGIFNCVNYGNIDISYLANYVGGISGWAFRVVNCANYGDITGPSTYQSSAGHMAGIVAHLDGYKAAPNETSYSAHIEGCYNAGEISGSGGSAAGVMVSGAIYTIANCYNTGNVTNANPGDGKGTAYKPSVAGVAAAANSAFDGCYNTGDLFATTGGVIYNGPSAIPVGNPAYNDDGTLKWQTNTSAYTVSFDGAATINGKSATSFVLASGIGNATNSYTYTADNGASGVVTVTRGDKTVSLKADVTFTNLTEQNADIEVKKGNAVQTAAAAGVYEDLPNGAYTYEVSIDNEAVTSGEFLVVGVDREIALPDFSLQKVSVTFDVNVPNAVISVSKGGIPVSSDSNVFSLVDGETYNYTVSATYFGTESGTFTASAGEIVEIELERRIVLITFDFRAHPGAIVEVSDGDGVHYTPSSYANFITIDNIYSSCTFQLQAGLPYTYSASHSGYVVAPKTAIFTDSERINLIFESDLGEQADPLTPDTTWYDSQETEYTITTPEELAGLAKLVNEGSTLNGKTVTLANDLDLQSLPWTPIGTDGKPFEGKFDGNGKTITGLYIKTAKNYQALFGNMSGELQDLTVYGSVDAGGSVAGIAAVATGKITGVVSYVNVTASGDFVGGIVGDAIGEIVIDDCHNHGDLLHTDTNRSTGRVGGIIGRVDNGQWAVGVGEGKYSISAFGRISNCSNTGNIKGYQYVGGIIGGQFGNIDIQYCYNSGNLEGVSFGKLYMGGIAGKSEGGTIDSCYNLGDIYDSHWSEGHIRAVGGIAGSEEGRADGTTAITNCYTTGEITLRTDNMGTGSIYTVGNISGGNQVSYANQMRYTNAFYLEGLIPQGSPTHEDYAKWSDNYRGDNLTIDTAYTTKITTAQLKGETTLTDGKTVLERLGAGFAADANNINGGYPILAWQSGDTTPIAVEYTIGEPVVTGGTDESRAVTNVSKAPAGATVTISVTPEAGKRIFAIEATDAAGNKLTLTEVSDNIYTFAMPGRRVDIAVRLENDVTEGEAYTLTLPTDLDLIWTLTVESSGLEDGKIKAGSTVFVTVKLATGANTATYDGIALTPSVADLALLGAEGSGKYSFTMPESNVALVLNARYSPIAIREQKGPSGAPVVKQTYTREQMIAISQPNVYYSGWADEKTASIGRADLAVPLTKLLADAEIKFESGDKLKLLCIDGYTYEFTYDVLMGVDRFYFPNITTESAVGKTPLSPILVVKGNATTLGTEPPTGDMLNTYRFIFGQSDSEFTGHTKAGNNEPKHVTAITIIKPLDSSSGTGGGDGEGSTGTGNIHAAVWDGKSIDINWFTSNPNATVFNISTPAEFAGLAALVNGLYNDEIDTIAGDKVNPATGYNYIHANFATSSGSSGPLGQNISTPSYYYGDFKFKDKTIVLNADINMGSANYMPIGGQYLMRYNDPETKLSSSFCGTLDGQGHTVTVNSDRWAYNYGDGQSVGLIGRLGVHDNDPDSWAPAHAGVKNIIVRGSISANRSVGGIVGKIGKTSGTAIIENCANYATISATDAKGVGGIVGAAWNNGLIVNTYNAGNISETLASPAGGIAGSVEIPIVNSYNYGTVTAPVGYAMAIGTNNGGGSYINSYYLRGSAASGGWYTGGAGGRADNDGEKVDTYMQSKDFVTDLNQTYNGQYGGAWTMDTRGTNRGFPILTFDGSGDSGKDDDNSSGGLGDTENVVNAPSTTTVEDESATTILDDKVALTDDPSVVVIKVDTEGQTVNDITAKIPGETLQEIADNGSHIEVQSDIATIRLPNKALTDMAKLNGEEYEVKAAKTANGGLTVTLLSDGETIAKVDGGIRVTAPVANAGAGTVAVLVNADGTETILKKSYAKDGNVIYTLEGSGTVKFVNNAKTFDDVKPGAWYEDAVAFVTARELFNGTSATTFAPELEMTRAMLATVLYRLEGEPAVTSANPYTDVKSGEWYTDAIIWASENGIVNGYGDGIFGTDDNITREQIVTILYRYAKFKGYDVSATTDLAKYDDAGKVSDYALDAVKWANKIGLLNGRTDTELAPQGNATRAEVATLLMRFIENVAK